MMPPSLEIDLARMLLVVLGALCTTFAPVSFQTPSRGDADVEVVCAGVFADEVGAR